MTDSGQTTKKEKDSPAGENLLRYLRQQQLIYLLRVLVIGLSTFEENQSPESGEFEAPEEMLPGLEKLDKSQRARMQVAVCFAMNLRRPETKSEWKILSRWIAFFSGQIKKESHRRYQTEWYNEQFSDIPMRSNKLAGFFIWYRTEMSKQGVDVTSLPATLATLHKRAEDFELAPNRDSAIRAGISKMAQLLGEPDPIREAEKPVSAEVNETLFAELDGLKQKMGVA